jgi:hypothetical protein
MKMTDAALTAARQPQTSSLTATSLAARFWFRCEV